MRAGTLLSIGICQPQVSSRFSNAITLPLLALIEPATSFPLRLETGTPMRNTPTASPVTADRCLLSSAASVWRSYTSMDLAWLHEMAENALPMLTGAMASGDWAQAATRARLVIRIEFTLH